MKAPSLDFTHAADPELVHLAELYAEAMDAAVEAEAEFAYEIEQARKAVVTWEARARVASSADRARAEHAYTRLMEREGELLGDSSSVVVGRVRIRRTGASQRVVFDSAGLDALMATDARARRLLHPHRRATFVAPTVTLDLLPAKEVHREGL